MSGLRSGSWDGDRHPWNDTWCGALSRILLGGAPGAPRPARGGGPAGLGVGPWGAGPGPRIAVGRTPRRRGGGTYLFPVRVEWDPAPLVRVTSPVRASWSAVGMGIDHQGTCLIRPGTGPAFEPLRLDGDRPPENAEAAVMEPGQLEQTLQWFAEDGRLALWDAVTFVERYVDTAVHKAHAFVSKDVAGSDDAPPLLDEQSLVVVHYELTLGSAKVSSSLLRIVDRSLSPLAYAKVDPQRYVVKAVDRDAQEAVRRAVGDPKSGTKIRALARQMGIRPPYGEPDIEAVTGRYRQLRPAEKMGRARVAAALSTGPVSTSRTTPISPDRHTGREEERWQHVAGL